MYIIWVNLQMLLIGLLLTLSDVKGQPFCRLHIMTTISLFHLPHLPSCRNE